MPKRATVLIGIFLGVLWTIGLLYAGLTINLGPLDSGLLHGIILSVFPAALLLMMMIGVLAAQRFFQDAHIDGQPFRPDSRGDINQRVLANTVEQMVLAICIWPLAGALHGVELLFVLGTGFAVARILFWVGYHISPPLRGFGFAASFYPTVGAAIISVVALLN